MTSYPVLDDNTRNAFIIGAASTADEAAVVWHAHMDDDALDDLIPPSMFCWRDPDSLSAAVRAECPEGAFEPVFA